MQQAPLKWRGRQVQTTFTHTHTPSNDWPDRFAREVLESSRLVESEEALLARVNRVLAPSGLRASVVHDAHADPLEERLRLVISGIGERN